MCKQTVCLTHVLICVCDTYQLHGSIVQLWPCPRGGSLNISTGMQIQWLVLSASFLCFSLSVFLSVSWEGWKVRSAVLERVKVCITPHSCVFSPPLSQSLTGFLLFPLTEHKEGPEWRKAVPSYTQSSSSMDFRNWNTLPRDESQESLPKNWEMAYTETGMVYFIE